MRKEKRSQYKCASITLVILLATFYSAYYRVLPIEILPLDGTSVIIILVTSIFTGRFITKGFVKKLKTRSFTVFMTLIFIFNAIWLMDWLWDIYDNFEDLIIGCILPAIIGSFTTLHWKTVRYWWKDLWTDNDNTKDSDVVLNDAEIESLEIIEAPKSKIDPLIEDVAKFFIENQNCSTSMIQREFELGFNRAGRIMIQLEQAGIITPQQPPRQMLVSEIEDAIQKIEVLRNEMEKEEDEKETI